MKNFLIIITGVLILLVSLQSQAENSGKHLEFGIYMAPAIVFDHNYEFFSSDSMALMNHGADLRFDTGEIGGRFHFLPFVSFRHNHDTGEPMIADAYMQTVFNANDLCGGLRFRGWFLSWFGAYVQGFGGATFVHMKGDLDDMRATMFNTYQDDDTVWNAGGGIGVEFRISPAVMKKHGITKFNFGGEIGVGFIMRGDINFKPVLEGGDELSLTDVRSVDFGNFNTSGVTINTGITFNFF